MVQLEDVVSHMAGTQASYATTNSGMQEQMQSRVASQRVSRSPLRGLVTSECSLHT